MNIKQSRTIEQLVAGQETSDGAGVRLTRVLSQPIMQKRLDPFLMLDHFGSDDPDDYIEGFPNHPHRGFETITLMSQGRMRHRDSAGHEGVLESGGVQWMIAGSGVVHSELPEQKSGVMEGFQLWLNLPASQKMLKPWYKDFQAEDIPTYTTPEGVNVKVIAGISGDVQGAHQREITQPLYLDITMPPGTRFAQAIAPQANAFIYVYRQNVDVQGTTVPQQRMGILNNDAGADGVVLQAPAGNTADARVLLLAGKPLHEPIVQYGPFVMNTREEILQAALDYQNGLFA